MVDFETKKTYTLKVEGSNTYVDPQFLAWGPYKDEATIKVFMHNIFIIWCVTVRVSLVMCTRVNVKYFWLCAIEGACFWVWLKNIPLENLNYSLCLCVDISGGCRWASRVCSSQLHFWGRRKCTWRHPGGTSPRQGHWCCQQSCQVTLTQVRTVYICTFTKIGL